MLNKTSKKVLKVIQSIALPRESKSVTFAEIKERCELSSKEISATCAFLVKNDYCTYTHVFLAGTPITNGVALSSLGIYGQEFRLVAVKRYLLDNWIAILALLISIAAFVKSFFFNA